MGTPEIVEEEDVQNNMKTNDRDSVLSPKSPNVTKEEKAEIQNIKEKIKESKFYQNEKSPEIAHD